MLARTHEVMLRAAVARAATTWCTDDLPALMRGHRDEDDLVVLGVRLRAPGLSHTYRPGRRRGELFATNAKTKMLRCLRRATAQSARAKAAWWVGRACHLLGDMAVPARTRGVWHLLGDPLEMWLEERAGGRGLEELLRDDLVIEGATPAALAEELARASGKHAVDTTRTPWGRILYERTNRGERLYESEIEAQAQVLLPHAVAATAALLRQIRPPPRPV